MYIKILRVLKEKKRESENCGNKFKFILIEVNLHHCK